MNGPCMSGSESIPGLAIVVGVACLAVGGCREEGAPPPDTHVAARGISYWDEPRVGVNYFNEVPTREWFLAASTANIRLIRLTYGKWDGERRDFLVGSADEYSGLVEEDLRKLRRYLDLAESLGIRVVLAPLSLPGARFRQFNDGVRDGRLWTDPQYLVQAAEFWKDLANAMKDHAAVAGYDLLNEPHPEWFHGKHTFWNRGFGQWYQQVRGTPGDLNRFNRVITASIRKVDPDTPIILESGLYATPWAFEYLEALEDPNILYSFHMYEPYKYTTRRINQGRFSYPGIVDIDGVGGDRTFDFASLEAFFDPVRTWARRNGIPASRIFVGEFGCDRRASGAARYLADLLRVFNREGWHWAFYAYREDSWPHMDYELGTDRPGETYWAAVEAGDLPRRYSEIYDARAANPLWTLLKAELDRPRKPRGGRRE